MSATDPQQASSPPTFPLTTGEPLYSEFADDADMIDLVQMFVEQLPQRIDAVREALDNADKPALGSLAHQLKGSGGGYGFTPITDAAGIVEQQAKSDADLQSLRQSVNDLVAICRRATAEPPSPPSAA